MISIKDLIDIKKYAPFLVIPFFTVASIADIKIEELNPLKHNDSIFLVFIYILIMLSIVIITYLIIDSIIVELYVHIRPFNAMFIIALLFLTIALLSISNTFLGLKSNQYSNFWFLGFTSYGLNLIDRSLRRSK